MCMELRHKSLSLLLLKYNTVNRAQDEKVLRGVQCGLLQSHSLHYGVGYIHCFVSVLFFLNRSLTTLKPLCGVVWVHLCTFFTAPTSVESFLHCFPCFPVFLLDVFY